MCVCICACSYVSVSHKCLHLSTWVNIYISSGRWESFQYWKWNIQDNQALSQYFNISLCWGLLCFFFLFLFFLPEATVSGATFVNPVSMCQDSELNVYRPSPWNGEDVQYYPYLQTICQANKIWEISKLLAIVPFIVEKKRCRHWNLSLLFFPYSFFLVLWFIFLPLTDLALLFMEYVILIISLLSKIKITFP